MCRTVVDYQCNFRFSLKNVLSNAQTHSSNRELSIQLFCCDLHGHGKDLTFLKHRGFLPFQITNNGTFSPTAFATATPLIHILLCFPIEHLPDFKLKVLFGRHWWKRPSSPALYRESCSGKGESVRMFCTKMLSYQVARN